MGHTLVIKQCLCNWRCWVQTQVGSICRAVGRIRDTMGLFLFLFFLLFFASTLSPLLGIPENAGVM